MQDNEKKQITDIVNAFRLVNKDITESFMKMCNELESKKDFIKWKKKEKGNKNAEDGYYDFDGFFYYDFEDWYCLSCYGMYKKKVVGFTFVISIDYDENGGEKYLDFIEQLDKNINKNTPMLCIYGTYEPIDSKNRKLVNSKNWHYIDSILRFTDDWKNYEKEKIKYDKWIDVEVDYQDGEKIKDGYEGWYKRAKIKIKHITDISSKEEAHKIIDELIKCKI